MGPRRALYFLAIGWRTASASSLGILLVLRVLLGESAFAALILLSVPKPSEKPLKEFG